MLKQGDPVPQIKLKNAEGEEYALDQFKGSRVIIYFYPKDNTPGCTKEACSFRDNFSRFEEAGIPVIGISPDDGESHRKFKSKYQLPFLLLSDPEKKAAQAFGVWGEKKLFGKIKLGIIRSSFVINEKGRVEKVYPKVSPNEHAEQILKDLELSN